MAALTVAGVTKDTSVVSTSKQNLMLCSPLIDELKDLDAGLARRIADKYSDYPFDHGSKELDLKIDQATAYYMKKVKSDREHADEWQAEYRRKPIVP
jgi:hypothetical protein